MQMCLEAAAISTTCSWKSKIELDLAWHPPPPPGDLDPTPPRHPVPRPLLAAPTCPGTLRGGPSMPPSFRTPHVIVSDDPMMLYSRPNRVSDEHRPRTADSRCAPSSPTSLKQRISLASNVPYARLAYGSSSGWRMFVIYFCE